MKKAVLFDLDGTLWDSSREVALSWSMALEPYGLSLSQADVQSVMGKTLTEIAAIFLSQFSPEKQEELLDACSRAELAYLTRHSGTVYPDLEETLRVLSQDYLLGIVSNCQAGYIETFLSCTGLSRYFSDTECIGNTGRPKGENIRLVLERNGVERALYVGDTQKDLDAARTAGVPFLHAAYGFGTVDPSVPAMHGLKELPSLVKELL